MVQAGTQNCTIVIEKPNLFELNCLSYFKFNQKSEKKNEC